MSAIVSGLIGAAVAGVLAAVAEQTQKPARKDADGWKALRPGWWLHGLITAGAGVTGFIGYIVLFVGSARADAETQMIYAKILLLVFGVMTSYLAWTNYGRTIRWHAHELRVRRWFGPEFVQNVGDVRAIRRLDSLGEYRIVFRDGSTLRLSAYLHGTDELIATLQNYAD